MRNEQTFCVDFVEFAFLVEACIPPNPIARSMFWTRVIDEYYNQMTDEERKRLYEWIGMNSGYQHQKEKGNEDCLLFDARFNPDNQYQVFTDYEGKRETYHCFKLNDKYHTSSATSILDEYITKVEKIVT